MAPHVGVPGPARCVADVRPPPGPLVQPPGSNRPQHCRRGESALHAHGTPSAPHWKLGDPWPRQWPAPPRKASKWTLQRQKWAKYGQMMPNAKWDGWRLECPIVVGYSSYSCQFCGDIQPHSWKTGSVTKFAFFCICMLRFASDYLQNWWYTGMWMVSDKNCGSSDFRCKIGMWLRAFCCAHTIHHYITKPHVTMWPVGAFLGQGWDCSGLQFDTNMWPFRQLCPSRSSRELAWHKEQALPCRHKRHLGNGFETHHLSRNISVFSMGFSMI